MKMAEAIRRTREVIRRQHKALATEESMGVLTHMPATLTSEQKLERFLTDLALKQDAAST